MYARLLAAIKIGRPLLPTEHAHHVNGDKADDRLANIAVLSASAHGKAHGSRWERGPASDRRCSRCGCDHDERTYACKRCASRHWRRRMKARPHDRIR
jgi:hypothetical protein